MTKTFYKELYIISAEDVDIDKPNRLLFCGSSNWEHYFLDDFDRNKVDVDVCTNVYFIEFKNRKEFDKYLETHEIIDYSIEHTNPMVLIDASK